MAVTLGNKSGTAGNLSSGFTHSHTVAASSNIIYIFWHSSNGTLASSVTYNGVSCTLLSNGTAQVASNAATQIWYLVDPATGANNVSVTHSGGMHHSGVGVIDFAGADDPANLGSPDAGNTEFRASSADTSPTTLTISNVASGDWVIDGVTSSTSLTIGANQTAINLGGSGGNTFDSSEQSYTADNNGVMSWTFGGSPNVAHVAHLVKAAPLGSPTESVLTTSLDAALANLRTRTANLDAILRATQLRTASLDAAVLKLDNTLTASLDANVQEVTTSTVSCGLDASIVEFKLYIETKRFLVRMDGTTQTFQIPGFGDPDIAFFRATNTNIEGLNNASNAWQCVSTGWAASATAHDDGSQIQNVMANGSKDGQSSTDADSAQNSANVIALWFDEPNGSPSGWNYCSLDAFVTDGVRLNTGSIGNSFFVDVTFWRGEGVPVKCHNGTVLFDGGSSATFQGMAGDLLYLASIQAAGSDNEPGIGRFDENWVYRDKSNGNLTSFGKSISFQNGSSVVCRSRHHDGTNYGSDRTEAGGLGTNSEIVSIQEKDHIGRQFTLTVEAGTPTTQRMRYLAIDLQGKRVQMNSMAWPSSGSPSQISIDTPFTPGYVCELASQSNAFNSDEFTTGGSSWSWGQSDGLRHHSMEWGFQSGVATTNMWSDAADNRMARTYGQNGSTLGWETQFLGFHDELGYSPSDGYTIEILDRSLGGRSSYMAIESERAVRPSIVMAQTQVLIEPGSPNQTIKIDGFGTPEAFQIYSNPATTNTFTPTGSTSPQVDVFKSIGFCDGTNQVCMSGSSRDGATPVDVEDTMSNTSVISVWNGSNWERVSFESTVTDGIVLDTAGLSTAMLAIVIFFRSENSASGLHVACGNAEVDGSVTGLSFRPRVAFGMSCGHGIGDTTLFRWSYGVGLDQIDQPSPNTAQLEIYTQTSGTPTNNRASMTRENFLTQGTAWNADITSWNDDGITTLSGGAGGDDWLYMLFDWFDRDFSLRDFNLPTSTGNQSYDGEPFDPGFAFMYSTTHSALGSSTGTLGSSMSFGMTDGVDTYSMQNIYQDNVDPAECSFGQRTSILELWDDDATPKLNEAVFADWLTGGIQINYTTVDSGATQIGVLLLLETDRRAQASSFVTANLDAALQRQFTLTSSLDSALQKQQTATTDLTAALATARTATTNLNAALQAEQTATTNLDAAVSETMTAATNLDAALQAGRTALTNLDAALVAEFQRTASLDAALQVTQTRTASLDAALQAARTLTTSLDAALQVGQTLTASLDASIVEITAVTTSLDAALQVAQTETTSLDAALQAARTVLSNLDAVLLEQMSETVNLDAALQATQTDTANLDAALQATQTVTTALDAALQVGQTLTASLDASIVEITAVTTSLDAALQEGMTVQTNLDAALQTSFTATTNLDAALQIANSASTNLDAALQRTFTTTTSLNAALRATNTKTVSLDANLVEQGVTTIQANLDAALQSAKTRTTNLDAAVAVTQQVTTSLDAALQAEQTRTASLDAALRATQTETTSLDAALQAEQTRTTSLDAALQAQNTITTSLDAALLRANTITTDLTAALQKQQTLTASLDANLIEQGAGTLQANLDAALQVAQTLTASLDAALASAQSETASLDAVLQAARTASTNLSAALLDTKMEVTSLDAALQVQSARTTSLNAWLALGRIVSSSLDAVLVGAGAFVTASLDAALQKTETRSAFLDSALAARQSQSISLDSVLANLRLRTTDLSAAVQTTNLLSCGLDASVSVGNLTPRRYIFVPDERNAIFTPPPRNSTYKVD